MTHINLHDVVALTEDVKTERFPFGGKIFLPIGLVGTVVVEHVAGEVFEVEFAGNDGEAFAMETLKAEQLFLLHFELPAQAVKSESNRAAASVAHSQNGTAESLAEGSLVGQSLRQ